MVSNKVQFSAWLNDDAAKQHIPPAAWRLISHQGSLTKHLRHITNHQIEHRLLSANWGCTLPSEQQALKLTEEEPAWIRHIEWRYHNNRWVFARVVIPQATVIDTQHTLPAVGVQSLGEILFLDDNPPHQTFFFSPIDKNNTDYPIETEAPLWARHAIVHYQNAPLLITEIFFPNAYDATTR